MAAGFSFMDTLNKKSKEEINEIPKARFITKDISIFKMYRNKNNFYNINDIEELSYEILAFGLKQNLEVVQEPCEDGEYRIIGGERRWEALKLLVKEGYKEFEMATTQISKCKEEHVEAIEVIISNSYRDKTDAELAEEEKVLKDNLKYMRENGIKLAGYDLTQGKMRNIIMKILKLKWTKVGEIENVNNNLIEEFREEFYDERLTLSTANKIAGMSKNKQQEAYELYKETGNISFKEAKKMKQDENKEDEQPSENVTTGYFDGAAQPETLISKCFSCLNWKACEERADNTTYCKDYINKNIEGGISDRQRQERQQTERTEKKNTGADAEVEGVAAELEETDRTRKQKVHQIRLAETYYDDSCNGIKPFELRKNDRDYKVGDILEMTGFKDGKNTGRVIRVLVTFILENYTGLVEGYCIMGTRVMDYDAREGE